MRSSPPPLYRAVFAADFAALKTAARVARFP